jgi:hypothetical protein
MAGDDTYWLDLKATLESALRMVTSRHVPLVKPQMMLLQAIAGAEQMEKLWLRMSPDAIAWLATLIAGSARLRGYLLPEQRCEVSSALLNHGRKIWIWQQHRLVRSCPASLCMKVSSPGIAAIAEQVPAHQMVTSCVCSPAVGA